MNLNQFFSRGWPTRMAFLLGKSLPPAVGLPLARLAARAVTLLKPAVYRAAQRNLRHVLGPAASAATLDRLTANLFQHVTRSYYEMFYNVGRGVVRGEAFVPQVLLSPAVADAIAQALPQGRGLFICALHTANFDIGGIAVSGYIPVQSQVLSIAHPPPGFEFFNHLRERGNCTVTPISPESLRQALERLRAGGVVITGIDHPLAEGNEPVTFFGATAHLPTGYIRIPLKANCPLLVVSFVYRDGAYWIVGSPLLEMERTGDRQRDLTVNVQRVLAYAEDFIRAAPDQWRIFDPVWDVSPTTTSSKD